MKTALSPLALKCPTGISKTICTIAFGLSLSALAHSEVFYVTNVFDSGEGSLRLALENSNLNPGPDEIHFSIPGSGPHVIAPQSGLPIVEDELLIDGFTQSGASDGDDPVFRIWITSELMPPELSWISGLYVLSPNFKLRGMVVNGFECGVFVDGVAAGSLLEGIAIENNAFGFGFDGQPNFGSNQHSIYLSSTLGASVQNNECYNSGFTGIRFSKSEDGLIKRNIVGYTLLGISSEYSNGLKILENATFGCQWVGIDNYPVCSNFLIKQNILGVNPATNQFVPNWNGIAIYSGSEIEATENQLIGQNNIGIVAGNSSGLLLKENKIGHLDSEYPAYFGAHISECNNVVVEKNEISGFESGLQVLQSSTCQILENNFGMTSELEPLFESYNGLYLWNTSEIEITKNRFSRQILAGCWIGGSSEILFNENQVGIFESEPKMENAIALYSCTNSKVTNNEIGGAKNGIQTSEDWGSEISGNIIGEDKNGESFPCVNGIFMESSSESIVFQNTILGVEQTGISSLSSNSILIEKNSLLRQQAISESVPASGGILLLRAEANSIRENEIIENEGTGITVVESLNCDIEDNRILSNGEGVVVLERVFQVKEIVEGELTFSDEYTATCIGISISANSIAGNLGYGIDLKRETNESIFHVTLIYDEDGFPYDAIVEEEKNIAFDGIGPDENDYLDADSGPNDSLNKPILKNAVVSKWGAGKRLKVKGQLNGLPNSSQLVQIFSSTEADPSGFGEGETFLGEVIATTDEDGFGTFQFEIDGPETSTADFVTATATDVDGNTSEFSAAFSVRGNPGKK